MVVRSISFMKRSRMDMTLAFRIEYSDIRSQNRRSNQRFKPLEYHREWISNLIASNEYQLAQLFWIIS